MGGAGNYTVAFSGSDDTAKKFNAAIFYGTIAGHETIIKTYWTGSIAGIIELAQNEQLNGVFMADSVLTPLASGAVTSVSGYTTESAHAATVAMADNPVSEAQGILGTAKASTAKTNAVNAIKNAVFQDAGVTAGPAKAVALVAFQWVLGNTDDKTVVSGVNTTPPFTNITQQQAGALVKNGYLPLSQFTGNSGDADNYVFLVGRNEDSGTRNAAFAEAQTGFGRSANQVATSTTATLSTLALYPITGLYQETSITWNTLGHSGYNTGTNVATALSYVCPNLHANSTDKAGLGNGMDSILAPDGWDLNGVGTSKCYLISYLGISDVASVVGRAPLTYNGVPFSASNVNNGLYTFWNYEHSYYLTNGTNSINSGDNGQTAGTARAVADAIADDIYNADATFDAGTGPAGVLITTSLLATRQQAGSPVNPNY
jgi:hypothetical protein